MRRRGFGVALILAAVAGATACDEELVEPEVGSTLVLETVDARLLPVSIEESPGFVRVYRADTIRFLEDDQWSRVQIQDLTQPGAGTQEIRWESDGFLRYDGSVIVLDFFCDDLALCVAPDRLIPDADRYRIERPVSDTDTLVFYYRVTAGPEEPAA